MNTRLLKSILFCLQSMDPTIDSQSIEVCCIRRPPPVRYRHTEVRSLRIKKIETLRDLQKEFQRHTGVRDYSAENGVSPGICHQVAREEFIDVGDFIQATDSHTCMGGASNALTYGVGSTEYANLVHNQFAFVKVPESIRFEFTGELDRMYGKRCDSTHILWNYAKNSDTLDRSMEFGGPGLSSLSMDERATLCNMATECSAKTGICGPDDVTVNWLMERRRGLSEEQIRSSFVLS